MCYRKLTKHVKLMLHGAEYKTADNYLERLRVLHKSDHFLVVNKHEDLLYNSDERTDFRSEMMIVT